MLALGLVLYAAAVYGVLRRQLQAQMDLRLHEELELAADRVSASADGTLTWRPAAPLAPLEEEEGGARRIEVWSPAGQLLLSAASGAPLDLGGSLRARVDASPASVGLPGGPPVRVLSRRAQVGSRWVVVGIAQSERPLHDQLHRLLAGLALVLPLAVVVFGAMGHVLIGRLLSPIAAMAERSRRITAERLGDRLPVGDPHDEMGQLATTLNETFARLEHSFDQLRRFTADVSHELRTPLTAIRTVGEVGLQAARDAGGYRDVIESMLEEADRLTRLVDALLVLARAEAGELKLRFEVLDLAGVVREVCAQLAVLAEERDQALLVEGDGVGVRGDRIILSRAVANLVDNAIKYGAPGSPVLVTVRRADGAAIVEVIDRGPGIGKAEQERIFDRFYRIDKSRSRDLGGAGLGLSLVKWAAEAHGGRVELGSREGEGSAFRVILPAV